MTFKVKALQYDGTPESIKEFIENSYAFPADDVITLNSHGEYKRHTLKSGQWIIKYPYGFDVCGNEQINWIVENQPKD